MQYSVNINDHYLVNSLSWTSEKFSLSFQRLFSKVIEESTLKISYDWKFCFVLWFSFDIILFFTDFYVNMQIVQTETVLLFIAFLFLQVNIANFVKLRYTQSCLFFHRFFSPDFFVYYLAFLRTTLGHCRISSLTHQMFYSAFYFLIFDLKVIRRLEIQVLLTKKPPCNKRRQCA